MQLKLNRREDITVASWINDKEITSPEWEVYSHDDSKDDVILLVLIDRKTNNQVKIEIKKYIKYEDIKENQPEN
jgi:hypothetical protein